MSERTGAIGSHRGSAVPPGVKPATGILTSPTRVPSAKCFLFRSGPNDEPHRLHRLVGALEPLPLSLDCEYLDDFASFASPPEPRSTTPMVTSRAMSVITVGSHSLVRLPYTRTVTVELLGFLGKEQTSGIHTASLETSACTAVWCTCRSLFSATVKKNTSSVRVNLIARTM